MNTEYPLEFLSDFTATIGAADFKSKPEDFIVDEIMDVELSGQGEHLWLKIIKKGENTAWVAEQLANHYEVPTKEVQWSGLKDRHAITSQWFSLPFAIKKDLPELIKGDDFQVIEFSRHTRKLNIGTHKKNQFEIKLRNFSAPINKINERLEQIKTQGIPNHFGPQRFGRDGSNIRRSIEWFDKKFRPKKNLESILLSSARSYLFNEYLNKRIKEQTWQKICEGDICMLSGSHSWFNSTGEDLALLQKRIDNKELSITGPLWGTEILNPDEGFLVEHYSKLTQGIENKKVKPQRRPLSLDIENLEWQFNDEGLILKFALESGSYATSLLEHIFEINDLSLNKFES